MMARYREPDWMAKVRCPECGWQDYLFRAKVERDSLVRCPKPECGAPVESVEAPPEEAKVSDGRG
jgi:hypothetical protein